MFTLHREEVEWGGRTLVLETGRVARQADGAVLATYGGTSVLATVVAERTPRAGVDFLPLVVHYQERVYAAGRIPGGYFKREGRPSEKETLTSRLIDRPIRPLFVEGFRNETQVVVTVLSHDMENDPDVLSVIAASAALTISGLPFLGPIAAARVGYRDGDYVLNPRVSDMPGMDLDLIVSGTDEAVLMVESEARELSEEVMLEAVMFGHRNLKGAIGAILRLAEVTAKDPWPLNDDAGKSGGEMEGLEQEAEEELCVAYEGRDGPCCREDVTKLRESFVAKHGIDDVMRVAAGGVFDHVDKRVLRRTILAKQVRLDRRGLEDIRQIDGMVGILPRAHGSALFTRGRTQAMVVATLGTGEDEQSIDALEGMYKENFLLHYNFPPYSVGEVGRVGFTNRREVGHGKLAWRALRAVLPSREEFPYTIRVVSEITESDGSSSMATVCGASLAMMDAGVPLKRPTAGIAMGLVKEGEQFAILSDILGTEDYIGDMDFKVAGTELGITALQMDIKISGIDEKVMKIALGRAREGRLHILKEMSRVLPEHRPDLGEYAPRIDTMTIPVSKIRNVIGTGGKVIREIVEKTGARIDVSDTGLVKIAFSDPESGIAAREWITSLVAEPEIGRIYKGKVTKVVDFGAFVSFLGSKDGLIHISQLSDMRVARTEDVVEEGQEVWVKVLSFDDRGKIRLSMKVVNQVTGESIEGDQVGCV